MDLIFESIDRFFIFKDCIWYEFCELWLEWKDLLVSFVIIMVVVNWDCSL